MAEGQASPLSRGELFHFHGGTSLLSAPGGSRCSRLSRCKPLAPRSGQTTLRQTPCYSGSSERKSQKIKQRQLCFHL